MTIDNYYDRTDPSKKYEKHLFRAGYGLQSAEQNEIQEHAISRIKGIGDALFKDGDIVSDCACLVNDATGLVKLNAGTLYLRGAVRGVAPAEFAIPTDQTVYIGIRLIETIITELEDPSLTNPATGTRGYGEPGAARLKVEPVWGWPGDGIDAEFYAVYTAENGILLNKEPPPQLDSVTNALARYDRDSAGGAYVVSGLSVTATYDSVAGKVTTLVSEGRARVNGYAVDIPRSVRVVEDSDMDTLAVVGEPRTFSPDGSGKMRINTDNSPLVSVDQVRITAEKTVTLTHGAFSGAQDPMPDNSILSIQSVSQGATTYTQGTDYKLTSGKVDWSLTGAEPAPGSQYSVIYRYQTTSATVDGIDSTGFTVSGAVAGTIVTTDYHFALPRIDAITLDEDGQVSRIKGAASQYNPAAPSVPAAQLRIASLRHTWSGNPVVTQDAVVVMPMDRLQGLSSMVIDLYDLVAQERLRNDVSLTDPAAKRGVFVDPFINDNQRDAGAEQNAAIVDGVMMLPISDTVHQVGAITAPVTLDYTLEPIIEQVNKTGSIKINPYQAFDPIPARVTLKPAVDQWTVVNTTWASPVTRRFVVGSGNASSTSQSTSSEILASKTADSQFMRSIQVQFSVAGFGPGEQLQTMTIDGIAVTPEVI